MTRRKNKVLGIIVLVWLLLMLASFGFYGYWNAAPPHRTCSSCHEIEHSYSTWAISAHRDINCIECHGTALSNGIHSLKEKARMVFRHYSREFYDDISLSEGQVLTMNNNCRKCHQSEYSGWISGGHGVSYSHIFLDENQNSKELLNYDCLRCHGMYYENDIYALVDPVNTEGPWKLKDPAKIRQPVIPCLACHKIHEPGLPHSSLTYMGSDSMHYKRLMGTDSLFFRGIEGKSKAGFYDRNSRLFLNASILPKPEMWHGDRKVQVSDDPLMRLCIQCHAPDIWKQAGSADDRTPVGVHEGISCLACHTSHSNKAVNSCLNCHPALSNCGLDVMTMNTSYAYKDSPHNIHFVACADCHKEDMKGKVRGK